MTRFREIRQEQQSGPKKKPDKKCALCGRLLGKRTEKHHLVPKSKGGTDTIRLHAICHRKIHALFNEKELAHSFFSIEALLADEDIQKFVKWVANKPPDFYRRTMKKTH